MVETGRSTVLRDRNAERLVRDLPHGEPVEFDVAHLAAFHRTDLTCESFGGSWRKQCSEDRPGEIADGGMTRRLSRLRQLGCRAMLSTKVVRSRATLSGCSQRTRWPVFS